MIGKRGLCKFSIQAVSFQLFLIHRLIESVNSQFSFRSPTVQGGLFQRRWCGPLFLTHIQGSSPLNSASGSEGQEKCLWVQDTGDRSSSSGTADILQEDRDGNIHYLSTQWSTKCQWRDNTLSPETDNQNPETQDLLQICKAAQNLPLHSTLPAPSTVEHCAY